MPPPSAEQQSVSIVVPVYNSEGTLEPLVERILDVFQDRGVDLEILLVNDGSRDRSWQVVEQLARETEEVCGINLMRNYGQHNALLCGIRAARHSIVVTMDDDLQNPPEEIPTLIAHLDKEVDVVYGVPAAEAHAIWRNVMSKLSKRSLARAMGVSNIRDISAFRAFRTELRAAFSDFKSPSVLLDVLLSWGTTRFGTVTVKHDRRAEGTSNYTVAKLFNQALLIMTGFSTAPLRLATIVGMTFTTFGFVVLVYVVGRYLINGGSTPGFPFLASIIAIFSGAQLFSIGIMGEYLARMFNRTIERPTYAIGASCKIHDQTKP